MTREEWLLEAKYLFHTNLPSATSAWVDEVAEALCSTFRELEPDEAVALYVVMQSGPRPAQASIH